MLWRSPSELWLIAFVTAASKQLRAMLLLGAWQEEKCLWSKYSLHLESFWSLLHLR